MAAPRVSYRRRMHYATRGNKMKLVRTPGNRLVMQKRAKRCQGPHCPWVLGHKRLQGTKALGHSDRRNQKTAGTSVSRPYGGVLTHDQVRDRIVRAFLIEERRIAHKAKVAEDKFRSHKKCRDRKQKKRLARIKTAAKSVGAKTIGKKLQVSKKAVAAVAKNNTGKDKKKTTVAAAPKKVPVGAQLAKK